MQNHNNTEHDWMQQLKRAADDIVAGGKADNTPASAFPKKELAAGKKVEMEHTNSPQVATEIAKDHLAEFDDYYTRLEKMEEEAKKASLAPLPMGDLEIHDREDLGLDIFRKTRGGPEKLSFFNQGGELGLMEWLAKKYPAGRGSKNVLLGNKLQKGAQSMNMFAFMDQLVARIEKRANEPGKKKADKPCPGSKIRSKGKGRGLGRGKGKGPIGVPIGEKTAALLDVADACWMKCAAAIPNVTIPSAAVARGAQGPAENVAAQISALPGSDVARYQDLSRMIGGQQPPVSQQLGRTPPFTAMERNLLSGAGTSGLGDVRQLVNRLSERERQQLANKLQPLQQMLLDNPEAAPDVRELLGSDAQSTISKLMARLPAAHPTGPDVGGMSLRDLRQQATGDRIYPGDDETKLFQEYLSTILEPREPKSSLPAKPADPGVAALGASRVGPAAGPAVGATPAARSVARIAQPTISPPSVAGEPGILQKLLAGYRQMPGWAQVGIPAVAAGGGLGAYLANRGKKDDDKD